MCITYNAYDKQGGKLLASRKFFQSGEYWKGVIWGKSVAGAWYMESVKEDGSVSSTWIWKTSKHPKSGRRKWNWWLWSVNRRTSVPKRWPIDCLPVEESKKLLKGTNRRA